MVNNVIGSYPESSETIHFKETKSRNRSSTANGQSADEPLKTIQLVDKCDDDCPKAPLNADELIKRAKLTDDHTLYELLNKELIETGGSVLSSYLANEQLVNESQFLANGTNLENELPGHVLIDEFENSIEINESADSFNENKIAICDNNQLSDSTFNHTTLQNDPFLSFPPYHFSATSTGSAGKPSQASLTAQTAPVNSQSSNLSKILLSNQDINKPDQFKTDLRPTLNGQTDLFQFGRQHSPRSSSPSDYIKLDSQENEQIKMNQTNGSMNSCSIGQPINSSSIGASIESIDPIIGEKRPLSSQKLNGEDLLFSLTSEDLNDMTSYFSLLNSTPYSSETKEKSSGFNCSPSLDSVDSMFCGSSVWDSPPPSSTSSNNSSLNNDLDLPFILSSDSNDLSASPTNEQSFLDSEFPFLSEDSIFNSFVNSNLNDLINTDAFFDEKLTDDLQFENNLNSFFSCSNFNSGVFGSANDHGTLAARTKKHCTLSKDSNLAKLLREKLPIKLPSQSNQTKAETNSSNLSNSLKTKENSTTASTSAPAKADLNTSTVNTTNNSTNSSTNAPTGKDAADSKKNGLVPRKFTIQGVNINGATLASETRSKTAAVSTGCLTRSIKIIDPVAMQVAGGSNVKYVLNNYTAPPNGASQNSYSLNITPANCLTLTTNASTSSLASSSVGSSPLSTAPRSFIIKSSDGKIVSTNGILYTPISRNGTNIAYASSLTANAVQPAISLSTSTSTSTDNKSIKFMTAFASSSPLLNNRKLVQKRPFSSMSVSIPSNSSQTTKDCYSIDLVPNKPITTNLANLAADTTFDLSAELKKKVKTTLENGNCTPSASKSHSSSKFVVRMMLMRFALFAIAQTNSIPNSVLQSYQRTQCCSTCW